VVVARFEGAGEHAFAKALPKDVTGVTGFTPRDGASTPAGLIAVAICAVPRVDDARNCATGDIGVVGAYEAEPRTLVGLSSADAGLIGAAVSVAAVGDIAAVEAAAGAPTVLAGGAPRGALNDPDPATGRNCPTGSKDPGVNSEDCIG